MPASHDPPLRPGQALILRRYLPGLAKGVSRGLKGRIMLTFDDGPDATGTPAVLDVLAQADARATFFVVMDAVREHPDLVRQTVEAGHSVELHSDVHEPLTGIALEELAARLTAARDELTDIVGTPVRWFRPPMGYVDTTVMRAAAHADLGVMGLTHDPMDWVDPPRADLTQRLHDSLVPGAIVGLHDGCKRPDGRQLPIGERCAEALAATLPRLAGRIPTATSADFSTHRRRF